MSEKSGVSVSGLKSIFKKGVESSQLSNVIAIAKSLGLEISCRSVKESHEVRFEQARRKAENLAGMLQGTMALESQAITNAELEEIIKNMVHELMAGSSKRLWAE